MVFASLHLKQLLRGKNAIFSGYYVIKNETTSRLKLGGLFPLKKKQSTLEHSGIFTTLIIT